MYNHVKTDRCIKTMINVCIDIFNLIYSETVFIVIYIYLYSYYVIFFVH